MNFYCRIGSYLCFQMLYHHLYRDRFLLFHRFYLDWVLTRFQSLHNLRKGVRLCKYHSNLMSFQQCVLYLLSQSLIRLHLSWLVRVFAALLFSSFAFSKPCFSTLLSHIVLLVPRTIWSCLFSCAVPQYKCTGLLHFSLLQAWQIWILWPVGIDVSSIWAISPLQ